MGSIVLSTKQKTPLGLHLFIEMTFKSLPLVFIVIWSSHSHASPDERRLLHDLLLDYNPLERPVIEDSNVVKVKFGVTLQQIIGIDEKKQILMSNIWHNLEWHDPYMQWNESEYGNIKDIRLPPSKLWIPDIMLYNNADNDYSLGFPTNVVVSSNGNCLIVMPKITNSTCKIDRVRRDQVNCDLKFGSWTYHGFKVDIQGKGADKSSYVTNEVWDLTEFTEKRNKVLYECCPEPYLDLTYHIRLDRRVKSWFNLPSGK